MILEDLVGKNLEIKDVVNIIKTEKVEGNTDKKLLPIFMLTFGKSEDIKKIFGISTILGLKVRIEPLCKRIALIPQSKKCQAYGRTQAYCNRDPRCVKCAGKHLTAESKIKRLKK